jgi:hypothetical protein
MGQWVSVDLAAAIRKLASVALKARRQNELSLIRTRMVRSGKATQRFISRTVFATARKFGPAPFAALPEFSS